MYSGGDVFDTGGDVLGLLLAVPRWRNCGTGPNPGGGVMGPERGSSPSVMILARSIFSGLGSVMSNSRVGDFRRSDDVTVTSLPGDDITDGAPAGATRCRVDWKRKGALLPRPLWNGGGRARRSLRPRVAPAGGNLARAEPRAPNPKPPTPNPN